VGGIQTSDVSFGLSAIDLKRLIIYTMITGLQL